MRWGSSWIPSPEPAPAGLVGVEKYRVSRSARFVLAVIGAFAAVALAQATPALGADFTIDDATPVLEGDAVAGPTATFTVTLTGALPTETYTVDVTTADVTADAGVDFNALSPDPTTLTFSPGDPATKTVDVTVIGDNVDEINETFNAVLSNPTSTDPLEPVPGISDGTGVGTITDDDGPTVSVSAVTATPGEAVGTAGFNVSLSAPSPQTVTVSWQTVAGTATPGSDFTGMGPLTVTFLPGDTTQQVSVPVIDDTLDEGAVNETFSVTLSNPTNATLGTASVQIGIVDNDVTSFSIADASVTEGTNSTATFVITRDRNSDHSVSVTAATATDSLGANPATAGSSADYDAAGPTLFTFTAGGATTANFTVTVHNDSLDENLETFLAELSGPSTGTNIIDGTAVGSITDDDAPPTVAINSISQNEGNSLTSPANLTVSLSGPSGKTVTVNAAVTGGTATVGSDYAAGAGGTLTFLPGETSHPATVTINGDPFFEASETVNVGLSSPSNADLGAPSTGVITIVNDDATPTLEVTDVTVGEAVGTAQITVTRTGFTNLAASAAFSTADSTATAGSDYTNTSGTATVNADTAATATSTISVPINNDLAFEGPTAETFTVTLGAPVNNATVPAPGATATVSITDNDNAPTLSIDNVTVSEADGSATFTVTRTGLTQLTATAQFATANGTATEPGDYTSTLASISIAGGGATGTDSVTVPITNNTVHEATETFTGNLTSPGSATIADGQGVATVNDDDAAPVFSVNDVSVAENVAGGTASFTVTLTGESDLPASVNFATANGSATQPSDYATNTGTLNFAAGSAPRTQAVTVSITDDALSPINEPTETYAVNLSGAVEASIGDAQGVGTITDNDTTNLAIGDVTVPVEGNGGTVAATFSISLTIPSSGTINLDWATADGTPAGLDSAVAGADYVAVPSTPLATFTPGQTLKQVTVNVVGDTIDERNETFRVLLSNLVLAQTGVVTTDLTANGLITDDDAPPTISIANVSVAEAVPGGVANFLVTLSGASGLPIDFTVATASGTATTGVDFTALAGAPFTIPAGSGQINVPVAILDEAIFENDETFTATISGLANATAGAQLTATGTIRNNAAANDDPVPTLTLADNLSLAEGGVANSFGYSLSNPSAFAIFLTANTANGPAPNASAPQDYTALAGSSVVISALSTVGTIPVTIVDDALDEDLEGLTLTVAGTPPSQVTIGDGSALGRITDNDAEPALSINEVFKTEGNSGTSNATVTVTLTPVSGRAVNVTYATGPSGVGADATAGADYSAIAPPQSVTFLAGETTKAINVPVIGDTEIEGSETVGVTLSTPINATLPNPVGLPPANTGLIVIVDDDEQNLAPTAGDDNIVTARNTQATVNVLGNDIDANANTVLLVTDFTAAAHGTAFCTARGVCTYIPSPGYLGPDSFTYTVNDGQATDVGTVNVTVFRPNNAPVANADTLKTVGSFAATVDVKANDTDAQGDALTFALATPPAHGAATCTAAGTCTYKPTTGYLGSDSFTYTATDIDGLAGTGTVTVSVVRRKALTLGARADAARVKAGKRDGYRVTITNPNPVALTLQSVSICLPAQFRVVRGSTSGAITGNPRTASCGAGRTRLTWPKKVTIAGGKNIQFRFKVTAGGSGRVRITVTGKAQTGFTVTPTKPVAPITVTK